MGLPRPVHTSKLRGLIAFLVMQAGVNATIIAADYYAPSFGKGMSGIS